MTNSNKPKRKPCPTRCPCLCHDTGGGVQEFHAPGGGPCMGKFAGRVVENPTFANSAQL